MLDILISVSLLNFAPPPRTCIHSVSLWLSRTFVHTYVTCDPSISTWSEATNPLTAIKSASNDQETSEQFIIIASKSHCMDNKADIISNMYDSMSHDKYCACVKAFPHTYICIHESYSTMLSMEIHMSVHTTIHLYSKTYMSLKCHV